MLKPSPFATLVATLCWLVYTGTVRADTLPRAKPEDIGFSSQRLEQLDQFYSQRVDRGELAGIVTLIARHGRVAHFSALGYADASSHRKLTTDSIFRLYSMTKPIASVALMMLYQEGRFQLTDPLTKYIPEFKSLRALRTPDSPPDDTVELVHPPTVQDAMRHTAGFTHGGDATALDRLYDAEGVFKNDVSLAEMMTKLSRIPLRYQPGTQFQYSIGPDIQARLVEVLSGQPFDVFLSQRIFQPLGMKDTGFVVPAEKAARLATVHWAKDGRLVPLDSAHGHPPGHGPSRGWTDIGDYTIDRRLKGGSAGLVSTAEDYWRFAQMMLNSGELAGRRILAPQVAHYMARNHMGSIPFDPPGARPTGVGFGLGFAVVKDSAAAGFMSSEGTFYWAGAAATEFWIDPKEDLVVIAMTQHMSAPGVENLRAELHTLVYSALTR